MFYLPFALIMTVRLEGFIESKLKNRKKLFPIIVGTICTITVAVMLIRSKNNYLLFKPVEDTPQYKFAEEINKTEKPKVLTFDVMDAGFYTSAGILPSNKFFCYLNIEKDLSDIIDEQGMLIDEYYFDYIICYDDDYDWDRYELVMVEETPFCDFTGESTTQKFCLYKLKP